MNIEKKKNYIMKWQDYLDNRLIIYSCKSGGFFPGQTFFETRYTGTHGFGFYVNYQVAM